jgi:hypothetical protein
MAGEYHRPALFRRQHVAIATHDNLHDVKLPANPAVFRVRVNPPYVDLPANLADFAAFAAAFHTERRRRGLLGFRFAR